MAVPGGFDKLAQLAKKIPVGKLAAAKAAQHAGLEMAQAALNKAGLNRGVAGEVIENAKLRSAFDLHHSDPIFMGGDPDQVRTLMLRERHVQLHRDLNSFLRKVTDENGNHMRPQRGNPVDRIQENFTLEERRAAMAEFYQQFRDAYADAAQGFFNQHPHLQ